MSVEPRLLNPTKVKIKQKNDAATVMDPIRRTPVNRVALDAEFSIDAQIKWDMGLAGSDPMATQAGVDDQVRGYMIVRTKDLAALSKTLKRGDRITEIGGMPLLFYITRIEYGAHYGTPSGAASGSGTPGQFKLLKVLFSDRVGQDG